MAMALCLFLCWERSSWQTTVNPVGFVNDSDGRGNLVDVLSAVPPSVEDVDAQVFRA